MNHFRFGNKATDAMQDKDRLQRSLVESQKQLQATIDDIKVSKYNNKSLRFYDTEILIILLLYHLLVR